MTALLAVHNRAPLVSRLYKASSCEAGNGLWLVVEWQHVVSDVQAIKSDINQILLEHCGQPWQVWYTSTMLDSCSDLTNTCRGFYNQQ